MFDHIGVQAADVEAAAELYLTAFAPLGMQEGARFPVGKSQLVIGLAGPDGRPRFWLSPALRPDDRELHLAFSAPDRAAVDAVHEAAVAAGIEALQS